MPFSFIERSDEFIKEEGMMKRLIFLLIALMWNSILFAKDKDQKQIQSHNDGEVVKTKSTIEKAKKCGKTIERANSIKRVKGQYNLI